MTPKKTNDGSKPDDARKPMVPANRVPCLILAAGSSARMGDKNKLDLPLGTFTLLQHVVSAACASKAYQVFVVRRQGERSRSTGRAIDIESPDAAKGMAHSLKAGLAMVPKDAPGTLVLLADMPFVTADHINAVLDVAARQPTQIVRPRYHAQPGHPVYWPRRLFSALRTLSGDRGGLALLGGGKNAPAFIDLKDDAVVFDVDTPERYLEAVARL